MPGVHPGDMFSNSEQILLKCIGQGSLSEINPTLVSLTQPQPTSKIAKTSQSNQIPNPSSVTKLVASWGQVLQPRQIWQECISEACFNEADQY